MIHLRDEVAQRNADRPRQPHGLPVARGHGEVSIGGAQRRRVAAPDGGDHVRFGRTAQAPRCVVRPDRSDDQHLQALGDPLNSQLPRPNSQPLPTPNSQGRANRKALGLGVGTWEWLGVGSWALGVVKCPGRRTCRRRRPAARRRLRRDTWRSPGRRRSSGRRLRESRAMRQPIAATHPSSRGPPSQLTNVNGGGVSPSSRRRSRTRDRADPGCRMLTEKPGASWICRPAFVVLADAEQHQRRVERQRRERIRGHRPDFAVDFERDDGDTGHELPDGLPRAVRESMDITAPTLRGRRMRRPA